MIYGKKIRMAVVGCGYFGQKRIQTLLGLQKHIDLAGVVDINTDKCTAVAKRLDIPYASTIQDLLQKSNIEAVIIATPNWTHSALTVKALSLGLHVLCEKPLTLTVDEAKKIVAATKKYKQFVKTGSNHRFFPSVQKAYSLYKQGAIGSILSLNGSIGNDGSLVQNSWFWKENLSGGGTFLDNGCHLLDLARLFLGDFTSCVGYTANMYWKKSAVEDIGTGIFITKNKQIATIHSSWVKWSGYLTLELWGDEGFMIIDSEFQNTLIVGNRKTGKRKVYDFSHLPKRSYHDELFYFANCILQNKTPTPNAADGYKVIAMVEGIYTSTKTGKWVKL